MLISLQRPELATERLLLKQFEQSYLADYKVIMGQDLVGKQLPKGRGFSAEETEQLFNNIIKFWQKNGFGIWAVVEKKSGRLIGHCGLNHVNELNQVEILYALSQDYWGKGYATEGAYASLKFGFDLLKLDKIIGLTKLENEASIKVLEKLGLSYQGNKRVFGIECRYFEIGEQEFKRKSDC